MKIRDLGNLAGPILLFGGPYSNLQATEALIAQAQRLGIAPSHCLCTGDVVAYGADALAVSRRVQAFGCPVVAGNCEIQLAQNAEDCGCGFEDGSACDLASRGWYPYAQAQLGSAERGWMAELPDVIRFSQSDKTYAVIHGGVLQVSRFIWPSDNSSVFAQEISALCDILGAVDGVFCGHSGIAFERDIDGVRWMNAGVIGMPPHDGRSKTRFALFQDGQFYIKRLTYDANAAAEAMRAAGLTQGYERALNTGIWPSEDVLPSEMRQA